MSSAMSIQQLNLSQEDTKVFEGIPLANLTNLGDFSGSQAASVVDRRRSTSDKSEFEPYGSGNGIAPTSIARAAAPVLSAMGRDQLLTEHLPTVRYLARRIHERLPQHVELEDLISAGVLGLIDAFSKFDHAKKVQFKSYAQFRIRGAILDSLRTLDWSPRELRRKGRAVEEAIRGLTQRFGRAPAEQEIAREMEISLTDYQTLLGDLKGLEIGSLHMERSEDSGDEELSYIPGSPDEDPLFRCLKGEMKQRLADAVEELPEKERMVLTLYYFEELTMKEIGLTLGVVESRVSQIHSSAVVRLRVSLAALRPAGGPVRAAGSGRSAPALKVVATHGTSDRIDRLSRSPR